MTVSGIVKMITADSVGGRNKTMHVLYVDGNMLLNIKQVGPGPGRVSVSVCVCVRVCVRVCLCARVYVVYPAVPPCIAPLAVEPGQRRVGVCAEDESIHGEAGTLSTPGTSS